MRDPKVGLRSWEWTAVAPTEEGVVREMARCLREIGQGRHRNDLGAVPVA